MRQGPGQCESGDDDDDFDDDDIDVNGDDDDIDVNDDDDQDSPEKIVNVETRAVLSRDAERTIVDTLKRGLVL